MARQRGQIVRETIAMNTGDILRSAMKQRGYTQLMLAHRMGYSGQNSIAMALSGRNMRVDILYAMLDELGFDLIVRDRNGSNKDGVWRVEPKAEEEQTGKD